LLYNNNNKIFSSNFKTFFCSTRQQTLNLLQSCYKLKLKAQFFKLLNNSDTFNNNSNNIIININNNTNER
jgi:hypothetical protein